MHGWKADLTVAGRQLSRGMHWDVELVRGSGHLYTAHEVWEIGAGSGYVNVSPTSDVRQPTRRSTARRVWPPHGSPRTRGRRQRR